MFLSSLGAYILVEQRSVQNTMVFSLLSSLNFHALQCQDCIWGHTYHAEMGITIHCFALLAIFDFFAKTRHSKLNLMVTV